eukprot:1549843-Pleurochrysis_carterae.AAC.1
MLRHSRSPHAAHAWPKMLYGTAPQSRQLPWETDCVRLTEFRSRQDAAAARSRRCLRADDHDETPRLELAVVHRGRAARPPRTQKKYSAKSRRAKKAGGGRGE